MSTKLVSDMMHDGLIACWSDETLIEVARRMCEDSIHALFVLNPAGHVVGVISQTDLAEAYVQDYWQGLTACDIMTPDVVTITDEAPLEVAIQIMLGQGIHRLLVVQEKNDYDRPIGVLSLSDVVCDMAGEANPLGEYDLELAVKNG